MQGNLKEIDIRSILQLIELGQRTGELFVQGDCLHHNYLTEKMSNHFKDGLANEQIYMHDELVWLVFFVNGKITYACNKNVNNLLRLQDYLHYSAIDAVLGLEYHGSHWESVAPEYAYVWFLLKKNFLSPAQGRSILKSIVQETLFDLLSLHQGNFIFDLGPPLAPELTSIEIAPILEKMMKQVQQWKQLYPEIKSPTQCPVIANKIKLREYLEHNAYKGLDRWADGQTSLRQISRYLNRDLTTVARAIYPLIKKGWVQLLDAGKQENQPKKEWQLGSTSQVSHVVCIDNDYTVSKRIEHVLNKRGYKTIAVSEPIKALTFIFQLKPNLILCDLAMPEIDGYQICAMLRHSTIFRYTPIIILSARERFIDRVKARMLGATDYLTKPFRENELLILVEKHLPPLGVSFIEDKTPDFGDPFRYKGY